MYKLTLGGNSLCVELYIKHIYKLETNPKIKKLKNNINEWMVMFCEGFRACYAFCLVC